VEGITKRDKMGGTNEMGKSQEHDAVHKLHIKLIS